MKMADRLVSTTPSEHWHLLALERLQRSLLQWWHLNQALFRRLQTHGHGLGDWLAGSRRLAGLSTFPSLRVSLVSLQSILYTSPYAAGTAVIQMGLFINYAGNKRWATHDLCFFKAEAVPETDIIWDDGF